MEKWKAVLVTIILLLAVSLSEREPPPAAPLAFETTVLWWHTTTNFQTKAYPVIFSPDHPSEGRITLEADLPGSGYLHDALQPDAGPAAHPIRVEAFNFSAREEKGRFCSDICLYINSHHIHTKAVWAYTPDGLSTHFFIGLADLGITRAGWRKQLMGEALLVRVQVPLPDIDL